MSLKIRPSEFSPREIRRALQQIKVCLEAVSQMLGSAYKGGDWLYEASEAGYTEVVAPTGTSPSQTSSTDTNQIEVKFVVPLSGKVLVTMTAYAEVGVGTEQEWALQTPAGDTVGRIEGVAFLKDE